MKNVYEVLWQKESDLQRVQMQVEALRSVIPLLTDFPEEPAVSPLARQNRWPLLLEEDERGTSA